MPKLTFHGQSTFSIETDDGTRLVIDPFFDDNPVSDIKRAEVGAVDFILCTHGHFDHFADALPLAKETGATLVSTFEIVSFAETQGVANGHPLHIGGGYDFPFGRVKMTAALHGGQVHGDTTGQFTTVPGGFLMHLDGTRIYHAGDTALLMDMQLLRGKVGRRHPAHRRQLHHGSGGRRRGGRVHRARCCDSGPLQHMALSSPRTPSASARSWGTGRPWRS